MTSKKILSEISKTLKELMEIHRERLEIEKRAELDDRADMKKTEAFQDKIAEKMGKTEQMEEKMKKEFLKMLGIKEEIDIEEIDITDLELGDDLNK